MYFVSENTFTLSIAVLFLAAVFSVIFIRRERGMDEGAKNYIKKKRFQYFRHMSLIISVMLLSIVLLSPKGLLKSPSTQRGIDQIWLLDVSASMDVVDEIEKGTLVSRLKKAKGIIGQYMLDHPENRYGLVVFAGDGRLISPLTSEYGSLLVFLEGIDSKSISEGGTDFTDALSTTLNRFDVQDNFSRAIVLLSDGGDKTDPLDSGTIKDLFYNKKVSLVTIGLGDKIPSPIPNGRNMFGDLTYKQFEGELVLSGLNDERLKMLADMGGGEFLSEASSLENTLGGIEKRSLSSDGLDSTVRLLIFLSLSSFLVFLLPSSFLRSGNAS